MWEVRLKLGEEVTNQLMDEGFKSNVDWLERTDEKLRALLLGISKQRRGIRYWHKTQEGQKFMVELGYVFNMQLNQIMAFSYQTLEKSQLRNFRDNCQDDFDEIVA